MKIRTQFTITVALFGAILVAVAASLILTNREVERLQRQENLVHEVELGARELSYLSNDYLLHGESQQRVRWEEKFASFSDLLAGFAPEGPEPAALVKDIKVNKERLKAIFTDVASILESRPPAGGGAEEIAMIRVSWSRMEVQNQGMAFEASRLARMLEEQADWLRHRRVILLFVLIAIFGAFLVINYSTVNRRILRALSDLQAGTRIIGSGNLEFAIEEKKADEIGDLSRAFNRMTADLRAVTASKADLEREMSERRQAEEALQSSEMRVRRKLESVLSPEGDLGVLELADLIDTQAMQKLMDDFYSVARIPMSILDVKGRVLVGVGWQDICTRFHRMHPDASRHCLESDTRLSAGLAQGEYRLYKCRNNLWDMATPIIVAGQHVGNIFTGQFFFDGETVDREFFRAQAQGYGFDEKEYLAALDRVPRLNREIVNRGMAFFLKLADTLSQLGFSNVKLARLLAERDRLTDSLRQSSQFPEENPNPVLRVAADGALLFANEPARRWLATLGWQADGPLPAAVLVIVAEVRRQDHAVETEINNPDGRTFSVLAVQPSGEDHVNLYGMDFTERKRAEVALRESEGRIRASLGEKEVLLKEIHHRVKNNLQVISSLVALQADELQDADMRAALQDLTHRVRSMAMVHEKLYQSADLARVEFAEYVQSLLNYLFRAHGNAASGVRLALELEPVSLSVNTAVPCGLILNELVGNALKHAFSGRAGGEVAVSLHGGTQGHVYLSVRDNGTGLPAGFDWRQARSLGLRLVQMLAGQLHAGVEVSSSEEGTKFEISFDCIAASSQDRSGLGPSISPSWDKRGAGGVKQAGV